MHACACRRRGDDDASRAQDGLLRTDNYSYPWREWDAAHTAAVLDRNGIGHLITQEPRANFTSSCGMQPVVADGSGFVNENTSVYDAYVRELLAKVKSARPNVKVLIYLHAFISGERNASAKCIARPEAPARCVAPLRRALRAAASHRCIVRAECRYRYTADRVLNREGKQLCYAGCCDSYPLFVSMSDADGKPNAYGAQLYRCRRAAAEPLPARRALAPRCSTAGTSTRRRRSVSTGSTTTRVASASRSTFPEASDPEHRCCSSQRATFPIWQVHIRPRRVAVGPADGGVRA